MRNRLLGFVFALGCALALVQFVAISPAVKAQPPAGSSAPQQPASANAHDFSGVWYGGSGGDQAGLPIAAPLPANATPAQRALADQRLLGFDLMDADLAPMTPAARAKFSSQRNQHSPNYVIDFVTNTDPFIKTCQPLGVPRVLLANHPFKIIQLSQEIVILYERSHDFREVYMDGRPHPTDPDPLWWGHSIGKWDGDTLVIDTVGLDDRTWLDYQGLPHSDALHVVERYRRVDHDTLRLDLTIDDKKEYTKTWGASRNYKLKPWDIGEEVCTTVGEKNFENGIVKPQSAPAAGSGK